MKNKLILTLILAAGLPLCGCKTAGVYDSVKTDQVKAALTPITASVVRRVILTSPQHADEIALSSRAVGSVFCSAAASGSLGPEQVLAAVDAATAGLQAGVDPEIIDAKNALLAIYRIFYGDRFRAELPADKWPRHVADLICASIDQGLKDAGKPGVK